MCGFNRRSSGQAPHLEKPAHSALVGLHENTPCHRKPDRVDGLKEVLQQQRAIGNILNRLTILANMGRISAVDLERTAQELADISAALRSIQEQGRRGR